MSPDTLNLLESNLARVRNEHVDTLLTVLTEAISIIHPEKRATVSESLALFQEKTFRALNNYIAQVRLTTLSLIENTNTCFTSADKPAVIAIVERYVEPSLYQVRFAAYEGAVSRRVTSFGKLFQLSDFRSDLTKATYEAGSINTIRRFLAALNDDLEVVAQKQLNNPISVLPTQESKLEQANRLIKLEPNFFGIGVNLNYFIRRLMGKRE